MLTIITSKFNDVQSGSSTTAKETAVTKPPTTFQAAAADTQQQAANRENLYKILGAAALIFLGFHLLDKKG